MATVVVTPTARSDLEELIRTLSLPANTIERFKASLRPLVRFPLLGAPLEGRWSGFRFILGPWRWMLIVYSYDEAADRVGIVTIQDARSATIDRARNALARAGAFESADLIRRDREARPGGGPRELPSLTCSNATPKHRVAETASESYYAIWIRPSAADQFCEITIWPSADRTGRRRMAARPARLATE